MASTGPSRAVSAERQAQLMRQVLAETYSADDLVGLARTIYVRVLFKLYGIAGGRGDSMTPVARQITAEILREQVGFYVTVEEVKAFLDDEEEPEIEGASKVEPATAPVR